MRERPGRCSAGSRDPTLATREERAEDGSEIDSAVATVNAPAANG
jgi:hypothetical protein